SGRASRADRSWGRRGRRPATWPRWCTAAVVWEHLPYWDRFLLRGAACRLLCCLHGSDETTGATRKFSTEHRWTLCITRLGVWVGRERDIWGFRRLWMSR